MSDAITPDRPVGHEHHEHHVTPGHGDAGHAGPFTEAEEQDLRRSDVSAATVIVCLITGIFCVGVVLYLWVFWATSTTHHLTAGVV